MRVEMYDQYSRIYSDAQNNGELVPVHLNYGETLDTSRYTLVHAASGFTTVEATDLTSEEAIQVVKSLYTVSKLSGISYIDKGIKVDIGYAELVITFSDGKVLNRVIYVKDEG